MDNSFVGRHEHEEFVKRMESENVRHSKRLGILEEKVDTLTNITSNIQLLANNMENMLKELQSQGQRLDAIENQDGDMWRKVVSYCVTCVLGAIVGLFFSIITKGV